MIDIIGDKTKQFFFVLIKLSIVVVAFCTIYVKLTQNSELSFNTFVKFLLTTKNLSFTIVVFLMVFTGINWFCEILKWQLLVCTIKPIRFKQAFEQALGALTASLFTPNRVGEYGAKAMYYSKDYRKRIVLLNLIGNIMQMAVTTLFGSVGLFCFVKQFKIHVSFTRLWQIALAGGLIVVIIGVVQYRYKWLIKLKRFVSRLSKQIWITGMILSILRYLAFSLQFYFLLYVFNTPISFTDGVIGITTMYFLSSIIPSIFIFDVVIKGSVALYVFSFFGVDELVVLSCIALMWLFNFVLPSIWGSIYVLRFKMI